MTELEAVFRAPVIESYAMTEASYQITSNPFPPQERKPGSVGVPAGPQVGVIDQSGNLLPVGGTGEIVIRGPNVMSGYDGNGAVNSISFTRGWFRTGDLGHLDTDGYLFLTGRLKEIINRGGEKISPREVDEVIAQHPAVAQVATFGVPHPVLGEEVAAAVILRAGASAADDEIRQFASERLADFKVPRYIRVVDEIPRTPTGKIRRGELAKQLGLPADLALPGNRPQYVAPKTPTETRLAAIWRRMFSLGNVGIHDNFFDLGGHSLLALCLLDQIAAEFGKRLRPHVIFQAPTIAQLAALLAEESSSSHWTALLPLRPNGSKPPLFWVHGDSSNAFLHRYLDLDRPLYGLMHQSADGTRARWTTVDVIASHYLSEIRTVQPSGPYHLGGYSFGGTIAFEIAQQLHGRGEEIALLFLVDSQFPGRTMPDHGVHSGFRHNVERNVRSLALMSGTRKLKYIERRIAGYLKARLDRITTTTNGRLKRAIYQGHLAMGLLIPRALRSQYILDVYAKARRDYHPRPYHGRATYIKSSNAAADHQAQWGKLFDGRMEVYELRGDHFDLVKEPHISVWAEYLRRGLNRVLKECRAESSAPGQGL